MKMCIPAKGPRPQRESLEQALLLLLPQLRLKPLNLILVLNKELEGALDRCKKTVLASPLSMRLRLLPQIARRYLQLLQFKRENKRKKGKEPQSTVSALAKSSSEDEMSHNVPLDLKKEFLEEAESHEFATPHKVHFSSKSEPINVELTFEQILSLSSTVPEPANSGMGSATISDPGTDEVETAKNIVRSSLEVDFQTLHSSGQFYSFRKAANTLVRLHCLPSAMEELLKDFLLEAPNMRKSFEKAQKQISAAVQAFSEIETLQDDLQSHNPLVLEIKQEEEAFLKKKDELTSSIADKKAQVVGLESQLQILKDEKDLDAICDHNKTTQPRKTVLTRSMQAPALRLKDLYFQRPLLESAKEKSEDVLLDIDSN